MEGYAPDSYIVCECCYKYFVSYAIMHNAIDADAKCQLTKDAFVGRINRITCPHCNSEFTFETLFYVFSGTDKFAVASHCGNPVPKVASFETACKISGASDWKFRECSYTAECLEKMRIFKSGLDDTIIEKLKLSCFDSYKTMNLLEEHITFVSCDVQYIYFEHRDFTDKLIAKLKIPRSKYDSTPAETQKPGFWSIINRDWATKIMEVHK